MKMHICIVSTPDEFKIRVIEEDRLEEYSNIVAVHPNMQSAVDGLARAQQLEKQMRPLWQAAIEHERRSRMLMLDAVYAIAKPPASD